MLSPVQDVPGAAAMLTDYRDHPDTQARPGYDELFNQSAIGHTFCAAENTRDPVENGRSLVNPSNELLLETQAVV